MLSIAAGLCSTFSSGYSALARMHWKCDDRSTELGLDSPTCSLLSNSLPAAADSGERVWCILLYLHAIFVATPTGEVSEVEIFPHFDVITGSLLYCLLFVRTCSQLSVFFRVHPLSVRCTWTHDRPLISHTW